MDDNYSNELSLESNGNQFCGASAIGDYWALTAAHCVDVSTRESETYELRAGTLIKGVNGTVHHVTKVIVHHGFNYRHLDNDIALIQVAEPFSKNKYVKYVRLPDQGEITPVGTKAWVAGWGLTKPGRKRCRDIIFLHETLLFPEKSRGKFEGKRSLGRRNIQAFDELKERRKFWELKEEDMEGSTSSLMHTNVDILETGRCEDNPRLSGINAITSNMLCAERKGKDSYKGDSGGPLVVKRGKDVEQIGIVSWGDYTGKHVFPGIYTKVSQFRLWIYLKAKI
uniref:Peptidase S1 domain-containing protein n=1 Tax=Timema shepardi TaxID=629360 RepID=A0A7R9G143_TIMSH|nr:unnamed protein product [Timema shepardi]